MHLEPIIQALLDGVLIGGVYGMIGVGLSLAFGVMRVVNFAHGQFVMLGMYAAFFLFSKLKIDPLLGQIGAAAVLFLVGWLCWELILKRKTDSALSQVVLTVAIAIMITNGVPFFFTSDYRFVVTSYSSRAFHLGDFNISIPLLLSSIMAMLFTLVLFLFMHRTSLGKTLSATAQNRDAAELVGIDTRKTYLLTFAISAAIAGAAGALLSPIWYIMPTIGSGITGIAFTVVVLGGMGNVAGALVGGVLLGIAESLGATVIGSNFRDLIGILAFILLLLFRPTGLFGIKMRVG